MTTNQKLRQSDMLADLDEIPPFPAVAIKALQFISNETGQLRQLSNLITTDAAISGELLRMANSALFGVRIEVSSILQAIHLLGLERIKSVVVTIAMKSYLADSFEVPALRTCWRHSLACAVIAERLAGLALMEADVAYTAGLLHDIGRLALVAGHPQEYANFLTSAQEGSCDNLKHERDLFGIDHCQAGLLLVTRWELPKTFRSITSRHHDAPAAGDSTLLSTVRRSCRMADALGFNVLPSTRPRNYGGILIELPERERVQLPCDPADLTRYISNKINSIESA